MICLYNVEGMLRKTIMILVCVGCCVAASAQTDLESLEKEYEANKRDIKVVKEYVEKRPSGWQRSICLDVRCCRWKIRKPICC